MKLAPYFLFILGLVLIFVEFFLPGGVLATLATLFLLASIVLFAWTHSFLWSILYIILVSTIVTLTVRWTIHRIRKGHFKGIYLHQDQDGYVASTYAQELIGKSGVAVSDLKPAGHILVEGKRLQALSKVGYIDKGEQLEVVGGEGAHLIVKRKEKET